MLAKDKREIIVLLRWVLIIALSYLLVFSHSPEGEVQSYLCIAFFLISNLILTRLPLPYFRRRAFDILLVTVDIALITMALWLCGTAGPDFFFLFFFVLFLAALGDTPALTAFGAALAAVAYLLLLHRDALSNTSILLRVPFFFVTALTYGYLAHTVREAAARAQAAADVLAAKTRLIGILSHEMRTPLNVIVNCVQDLTQEHAAGLTATQHQDLTRITANAYELLTLVDRTLLASRLEFRDIPVHLTRVPINELLQEARLAVEPYEKDAVSLTFHAEDGLPPLTTDRYKLKEILTNLVINALKYTTQGEVTVDIRRPDGADAIEIAIRDTGIGIPSESLTEMFALFARGPKADANGDCGAGLGLYIVGRLLDLLHGSIHVSSDPGYGSTFTVTIPCELPTDAAAVTCARSPVEWPAASASSHCGRQALP